MNIDFNTLNKEDREYWNKLYAQTSGDATSGGTPSKTTAVVPKGGEPPEDGDDENGDRRGRHEQRSGKKRPLLSRNKKDRLWSAAGALVGGLLAGGTGAAIGSYLASPRARMNGMKRSLPNTGPLRQETRYDDRLSEPSDKFKDHEKTFSQRFLDKATELQVGKSTDDYHDDYTRNRNLSKWIDDGDEDFKESVERRNVRAIVTEALKAIRNR